MTSMPEQTGKTAWDEVVHPSSITIGEDRRAADPAFVELMRADLSFQGQLQPILLVARPDGFHLVDGLLRLTAALAERWSMIDAHILPLHTTDDEVRFARIMANISRKELTKLERAEYLAELHDTWQRLNPSAQHGGDLRSENVRVIRGRKIANLDKSPIFGLIDWVAEKVGLKRAAIFLAISISRRLTPETKARLRGQWLEDHQAGLQLLAEQDAETQISVCDLLFSDPAKAGSVPDALHFLEHDELPSKSKGDYETARSAYKALSRPDKIALLRTQKKLVLEVAHAEGWID